MTEIVAVTTWFTTWGWTTAHEVFGGEIKYTLCGRRMRSTIHQAPDDMPRCRICVRASIHAHRGTP